jgi:hypothetical protein
MPELREARRKRFQPKAKSDVRDVRSRWQGQLLSHVLEIRREARMMDMTLGSRFEPP